MRKTLFIACILFSLFFAGTLYAVEVSEEKDIAIFGLTADNISVPKEVLTYAESSIVNEFIQLKRFNVLGYENYRLESGDVEEFIKRVRELQAEKAKDEGTYDEKFGTVVIKGEDFDRIVGSVLIVIPSVAEYRETRVQVPIITEDSIYYVLNYDMNIAIDLTFVNVRTGTREESLRISGSSQQLDMRSAANQAVDNAVSNLGHRLKRIEAFKIKSGVVRVQGDRVFFELGSDIGVKQGHEYEVLTRQEIGQTGRITQIPTGLVRVRTAYPELSEAQIVYQKERITEGDQLVEVPKLGVGLVFYLGGMQVDIPDMNYDIYVIGDGAVWPTNDFYFIAFNQQAKDWAPALGISVEYALGYRFQGLADFQAVPTGSMWGFIGEFGVGTRFFKRRFDLQLKALLGLMYMTSFSEELGREPDNLDHLDIGGERIDYDQNPTMKIDGFSFGAKMGASLNYRIGRGSSFRLGVNYRAYTPIEDWNITIEETSGSSKSSVDITSDSANIAGEGLKRVSISGFEFIGGITILF
jgi:hypothetical protein